MRTERKPRIPEWADACPGTEVRAVVQVLLLLRAGSTPVMPEETQGWCQTPPVETAVRLC